MPCFYDSFHGPHSFLKVQDPMNLWSNRKIENSDSGKFVIFETQVKAIRTISSIVLALLVLVSSTSFMVGVHLCMGDVQNVALFTKAPSCPNERQVPPCHRHTPDPCCEDEVLTHEAEELKLSSASITVYPLVAADVEQTVALIAEIIPSFHTFLTAYRDYIPPLRSTDLIIEHRVLLI